MMISPTDDTCITCTILIRQSGIFGHPIEYGSSVAHQSLGRVELLLTGKGKLFEIQSFLVILDIFEFLCRNYPKIPLMRTMLERTLIFPASSTMTLELSMMVLRR